MSQNKSSSSKSKAKLNGEIRVAHGMYRLGRKIGSGSFGVIFEGTHVETGDTVAVKLEKADARHPQLQYESRIYKHMRKSPGVPSVKFYGKEEEYYVLVMDMLGPSLEDLFNFCGRKFSLKTILMLADEMLQRVESVHNHEFIHRDIKPDNFLIGLFQHFNTVYIIDFGLSKRYINPKTKLHIKFIDGKSLTGTARYASINTHMGFEQSRRDDLETLGYVLMYFVRGGKLPWQGLKAQSKSQKYSLIAQVKKDTKIDDLCTDQPNAFKEYLSYCRGLDFDQTPDYKYLRGLFHDLAKQHNYQFDYQYDWIVKATRPDRSSRSDRYKGRHHGDRHHHSGQPGQTRQHRSSHQQQDTTQQQQQPPQGGTQQQQQQQQQVPPNQVGVVPPNQQQQQSPHVQYYGNKQQQYTSHVHNNIGYPGDNNAHHLYNNQTTQSPPQGGVGPQNGVNNSNNNPNLVVNQMGQPMGWQHRQSTNSTNVHPRNSMSQSRSKTTQETGHDNTQNNGGYNAYGMRATYPQNVQGHPQHPQQQQTDMTGYPPQNMNNMGGYNPMGHPNYPPNMVGGQLPPNQGVPPNQVVQSDRKSVV